MGRLAWKWSYCLLPNSFFFSARKERCQWSRLLCWSHQPCHNLESSDYTHVCRQTVGRLLDHGGWYLFRASAVARSQPQVSDRRQIDDMGATSAQSNTATAAAAAPSQKPTAPVVPDELGPLPTGWEKSKNEHGRFFFIDHINKRTTWVGKKASHRIKWHSLLLPQDRSTNGKAEP